MRKSGSLNQRNRVLAGPYREPNTFLKKTCLTMKFQWNRLSPRIANFRACRSTISCLVLQRPRPCYKLARSPAAISKSTL